MKDIRKQKTPKTQKIQDQEIKSQKLKERDQIIHDNWDEIYRQLFYKISKSWMVNIDNNVDNLTLEAMSFIGDNIKSYNKEKSEFVPWAVFICYNRLIDTYRVRHRHENLYGLISLAKEKIQTDGEKVTEERIRIQLTSILGDEKGANLAIKKYKQLSYISTDSMTIENDLGEPIKIEQGTKDKKYEDIDWKDFKEHFIEDVKKAYEEKRLTQIQMKTILYNFIPKAENEEYRSFKEIADEENYSESYISQQIKYPKFTKVMKEIINKIR